MSLYVRENPGKREGEKKLVDKKEENTNLHAHLNKEGLGLKRSRIVCACGEREEKIKGGPLLSYYSRLCLCVHISPGSPI